MDKAKILKMIIDFEKKKMLFYISQSYNPNKNIKKQQFEKVFTYYNIDNKKMYYACMDITDGHRCQFSVH